MSKAIMFKDDCPREEIQAQLGKASAMIRRAMEMLSDDEYNERNEDWDEMDRDGMEHMPPMYRKRSMRTGRYY